VPEFWTSHSLARRRDEQPGGRFQGILSSLKAHPGGSGVPPIEQVLELAHPKPIIMRFLNRKLRDTVFQLKKFYSPREGNSGAGGGAGRRGSWGGGAGPEGWGADTEREEGGFEGRGRYLYPLYEDLSRASFQKMRAIANDSRTKACWSVKGQIKFTLVRNPSEVKRVLSLFDPLDDILHVKWKTLS
jgi:hypothetical protein